MNGGGYRDLSDMRLWMKMVNDHFSFPQNMSNMQKFKQFGNSVTIPVIEREFDTLKAEKQL